MHLVHIYFKVQRNVQYARRFVWGIQCLYKYVLTTSFVVHAISLHF
jgi:hypothetical protein